MGNVPAIIDAVASKPAPQMIKKKAAFGHVAQCDENHLAGALVACGSKAAQQEIQVGGMGKLGRRAEAAMHPVKSCFLIRKNG